MSDQTLVFPPSTTLMDRREAEECVRQIDYHMDEARRLIYELDIRKGWKALNYRSFGACVTELFSTRKSQLYRQRAAARVEAIITGDGSVGALPERVLRPLTKISEILPNTDQSIAVVALYTVAQAIAGDGQKLTSHHTEEVVEVLKEALASGVITDGDGEQHPTLERLSDSLMAAVRERIARNTEVVRVRLAGADGKTRHNLFPQSPQLKLSRVENGSVSYSSDNSPSIVVTIPVWMLKSGKLPNVVQLKLLAEDET